MNTFSTNTQRINSLAGSKYLHLRKRIIPSVLRLQRLNLELGFLGLLTGSKKIHLEHRLILFTIPLNITCIIKVLCECDIIEKKILNNDRSGLNR